MYSEDKSVFCILFSGRKYAWDRRPKSIEKNVGPVDFSLRYLTGGKKLIGHRKYEWEEVIEISPVLF